MPDVWPPNIDVDILLNQDLEILFVAAASTAGPPRVHKHAGHSRRSMVVAAPDDSIADEDLVLPNIVELELEHLTVTLRDQRLLSSCVTRPSWKLT